MSITDWPEADRPREKLLRNGAQALSDAELLAIFLRVGLPGKSAVDLARELLDHFGSLQALFAAPLPALSAIPGMGSAKFAQIQAVFEMARRALHEELAERDAFTSPDAVRSLLGLRLRGLPHEEFHALFLDQQHRLLAAEMLFRGSLSETRVYPREVVKRALATNAAAVIVAHNHPSGEARPSAADLALTQQLKSALELVEIRLLDHFIVAAHRIVSLAENGQC
ncbi:RadC family protein [Chitinilyticum litopenaei]|uniref:RadC family protein n=1 Tax=Chitinilyticum litopenaei TaxID=1121276 RepID=UPI0003F55839|nr:DNA repair protein RadC [Chitinilyticum litopenaei]